MTAFEIGEVVTPVTNILFNGIEIPTQGVQGNVTSRQKIGQGAEEEIYYIYQVLMSQVLIYGPEETPQTGQVFWFSESDLGNPSGIPTNVVDEGAVSSSISEAKGISESAAGTIGQIKTSVPPINPYFDTLSSYHSLAENNVTILSNAGVNTSDPTDLNRQGNTLINQSDILSSDSQILQELSENVYGFYTVTSELETQIRQEEFQAEEQESRAAADDSATFTAFVSTYIDSPAVTGLMIPGEGPPSIVHGVGDVEDGLASINPQDLITEVLDLEQD